MPVTTRNSTSSSRTWLILAIIAVIGFVTFLLNNRSTSSYCGDRTELSDGICSSKYGYESISIVVGNTQNSPLPEINTESVNSQHIQDVIGDVFYATDRGATPAISVISAASLEPITFDEPLAGPSNKTAVSKKHLEDDIYMLNYAMQSEPTQDGVDYLQAVINASKYLSKNTKSAIIVIGSGYNDTGDLNFVESRILEQDTASNASYAVSLVASDNRLTTNTLSGIDIYWLNLGVTVSPQVNLSAYTAVTENVYTEVFNYLGASSIKYFYESQFPEYSVDTTKRVAFFTPEKYNITGKSFVMNERIGIFYPDKATLKNEDEVIDWLQQNIVNHYNNDSLSITGYIAFCTDSNKLSLQRAEKVKSLLVDLGIPANKITTAGEAGPPDTDLQSKDCDTTLPDSERRTVIIEIQ